MGLLFKLHLQADFGLISESIMGRLNVKLN